MCHTQNALHSNVAALYINGSLREQRDMRSLASLKEAVLSQVQGIVGQATEISCSFGGPGVMQSPHGAGEGHGDKAWMMKGKLHAPPERWAPSMSDDDGDRDDGDGRCNDDDDRNHDDYYHGEMIGDDDDGR